MKKALGTGAHVLAFIVIGFLCIYPVLWLVVISFQPEGGAWKLPPEWIFIPVFDNYQALFNDGKFVAALINSLQVTILTTLACLVIGSLAGFALSRSSLRHKGLYLGGIALTRMLPAFAIVIPTFLIFRQLGLLDSVLGLVLALTALNVPLAAVIMFGVFNGISPTLDESARMDGAGNLRILVSILLPISRPGLVSSAVLTFVVVWNDFLFVLVLAGNRLFTVPVIMANFEAGRQVLWGMIAAASAISLIPIVVFIAVAQRQLLSGLAAGAVKE